MLRQILADVGSLDDELSSTPTRSSVADRVAATSAAAIADEAASLTRMLSTGVASNTTTTSTTTTTVSGSSSLADANVDDIVEIAKSLDTLNLSTELPITSRLLLIFD